MSSNSDPTERATTATAMAWATAAKQAVIRVAGSRWARCCRNRLMGFCPWWGGVVLRQACIGGWAGARFGRWLVVWGERLVGFFWGAAVGQKRPFTPGCFKPKRAAGSTYNATYSGFLSRGGRIAKYRWSSMDQQSKFANSEAGCFSTIQRAISPNCPESSKKMCAVRGVMTGEPTNWPGYLITSFLKA